MAEIELPDPEELRDKAEGRFGRRVALVTAVFAKDIEQENLRRKSAWLSMAAVLLTGLVLGLSTATVTAQKADKGGKHPHMQAALRLLTQAEQQLEKADRDYGGHRAKAHQLVKQAEQEIEEGIALDDKSAAPKPSATPGTPPATKPAPKQ